MPGNNGGSNWGSTAANPGDGTVYVQNLDLPAVFRLLRPDERPARGNGGGSGANAGESVYQRACSKCHGPDRAGTASGVSLVGVTTRKAAAAIRGTILSGDGQMPAIPDLPDADQDALIAFLTASDTPAAGRGRATAAAPVFPPGPVVASGPVIVRPPRARGPALPYPDGVTVPAERYQTDGYGLYANIIKPPFSTLTAYDLNTGTIKWQIGLGDDPRLAREGILGTGQTNTPRVGIIPTATGLVFVNDGNSRMHAYDADTGKPLWEFVFGAPTTGSGAMYELNGRQYLLVAASGGNANAAATQPRGYVAFALPEKK